MIDRLELIRLIEAARIAGRLGFARSIALDWLEVWPGDLQVQLLLSQIEVDQTLYNPAIERLATVIIIDPEYSEAYETLAIAQKKLSNPVASSVHQACVDLLQGRPLDSAHCPSWVINLMHCLEAIQKNDHETAISRSQEALKLSPILCRGYIRHKLPSPG